MTIAELRNNRVPVRWLQRDPRTVARALLGCALVHGDRAAMIVETEAYLGPEDLASHARFGPSGRSSVMYGPGGGSYVYLCYGVHEMFNVVTGKGGEPGAVLVRAAAPLLGLPDDTKIARGPGKLTRALGIDRRLNARPLDGDELFVARHRKPRDIAVTPRIGVAYAGSWVDAPLRFVIAGHPAVCRG